MFNSLIIYMVSALVGSMLFFTIVVSPSIFSSLARDQSGKFLRVIFPRMFLFCLIISLFALILSTLLDEKFQFYCLLIVSLLFFLNRNLITPKINFYRDKDIIGDLKAKKTFKILHLVSVLLFLINIVILLVIIFDHFLS